MFDCLLDKYWRPLRRTVHELLTRKACERHLAIQQMEAAQLMYDLLELPEVSTLRDAF
jgi:hypothetical protein